MATAISQLARLQSGLTLRGCGATEPVVGGRWRLVRIGDLSNDGDLAMNDAARIDPPGEIPDDFVLRRGDVLFPNRGTRTAAAVFDLDADDVIAGSQFFILRPKKALVLPEYLAWSLRTEAAAAHFAPRRKGSQIPTIQRLDLLEFQIPVPSLDLQKKIVALDRLRLRERRLAENLAALRSRLLHHRLWQCAAQHCRPTHA